MWLLTRLGRLVGAACSRIVGQERGLRLHGRESEEWARALLVLSTIPESRPRVQRPYLAWCRTFPPSHMEMQLVTHDRYRGNSMSETDLSLVVKWSFGIKGGLTVG